MQIIAYNISLISGSFFVQSTNVTGIYKDAYYLLADIKKAIGVIGAQYVFVICMDGACKKVLRLVLADPTMQKIFPQRCSTHGCNLLLLDIGKYFLEEIQMCTMLVKFVCNHDGIFKLFSDLPDHLLLMGACGTRFASQVYSCESILQAKDSIKTLWYGPPLAAYMSNAKPEVREQHRILDEGFISEQSMWKKVEVFVNIEVPIRELLRMSDGHKPNLADMSFGYDMAKSKSLKAAKDAELKNPELYSGLEAKVLAKFNKRRIDIVTPLCLAASMIHPKHVYVKSGESKYNPEGGTAAILSVINRYYSGDPAKQNKALSVYQQFREKSGTIFGGPNLTLEAKDGTGEDFWRLASTCCMDEIGCELFRKLINNFAGQGESERWNKNTKKHRTITRNRQSHEITEGYMQLDSMYKIIRNVQVNRVYGYGFTRTIH